MVGKGTSCCKYRCGAKNYLVGNSAYPKDSFRTIGERSNLLALGNLLWPPNIVDFIRQ